MALNTLALPYTRGSMNALVKTLELKGVVIERTTSYISGRTNGVKVLSALSATGSRWSVQMDAALAEELNLTLWKDM